MRLILVFLLILNSANAWSDCADNDFSQNIAPAIYQSGVADCFAFAASTLMSHKAKLKPPERVSVIDVISNYFQHTDAQAKSAAALPVTFSNLLKPDYSTFNNPYKRLSQKGGGSIADAISYYNDRKGICLESQLGSQKSPLFKDSNDMVKLRLQELEGDSREAPFIGPETPPDCPTVKKLSAANLSDKAKNLLDLKSKLNSLLTAHAENEIAKICRKRKNALEFLPQERKISDLESSEAAMRTINQNVDKKIPTAFEFNGCFLKTDSPQAAAFRPSQTGNCSATGKPLLHTGVVVGRRWNSTNKRCEYRMRNSWGINCRSYKKSLQDRCTMGDVWLTEAELKMSIFRITWIP